MIKFKIENKKFNENIFNNVNLEILKTHEIVTILGESGSGKTTLIKMLLGIDNDYKGDIFYKNVSIKKMSSTQLSNYRNNVISCVYQDLTLI